MAYQALMAQQIPWVEPEEAHRACGPVARCVLLVMNPRRLADCIESIRDLPVDQYWLTGFYERELVAEVGRIIEETAYDAYAIVSDDCLCSREAWAAVRDAMDAYPIVTGWCQVDAIREVANVSTEPLVRPQPRWSNYTMPPISALAAAPPIFRSWWIGFALSAMRRDVWRRFPFDVYPSQRNVREGQAYPWHYTGPRAGEPFDAGESSDYHLSWRMQEANAPVWAVRDAQVGHLRHSGNAGGLVNGTVPPEVTFRPWR